MIAPFSPRRRLLLRWIALLGAVTMGLGIAGSEAAERNRQVDLTVLREDVHGNCTVTWNDPWSGKKREGPFRCDSDRDPILHDWETGFVVSYGPWKGDLYNPGLENTPANAANDWLSIVGFLALVGSGVTGGARGVRRVADRRAARSAAVFGSSRPGTAPEPASAGSPTGRTGVSLVKETSVSLVKECPAETEWSVDLSYTVWAAFARCTALPRPEGGRWRPEADVRTEPWWRVRTLWQTSQLGGVQLGAAGFFFSFLWWQFEGRADVGLVVIAAAGGLTAVVSAWSAKPHGLAAVRRLVRAARAPVPVLRPYVLVHDPHERTPVLVLFPAHAGPDALPDAVLAVRPPGPGRRPWLGLPDPVGTADLRGWLDDEPTVVPWIEERVLWPLHGLREVRADTAGEDRRYLCRLMGASDVLSAWRLTCGGLVFFD